MLDCVGLMSTISTSTAIVGLLCLPSRDPSEKNEVNFRFTQIGTHFPTVFFISAVNLLKVHGPFCCKFFSFVAFP